MKKKPLIIIVLLLIISLQNHAQNTAVPDAEFEQALIDLGLDVDLAVNGQVPTAGIENVTSLDVSGKNISDLTGIEGFAALQILNCSNNNLTALNIDANQALQQLDCSNNTIGPFINTEFNQNLVNINAANNNLNSFDVEFNTILTDFNISNNSGITNIDLSLSGNLASLNLDNMSALEQLNIANSNNEGITTFSAVNTPKLFCTNVSNVAFAEANWTNRDAQNAYSTSCFYDGFITTWKTDNPGDTADDSIGIATNGDGYNYAVNWGDGTIETGITGNALHTYATPGTYIVQISGAFPWIEAHGSPFNNAEKLMEINQWGNIQWATFLDAFSTAKNMVGNFTDAPDLSNVTDMTGMFASTEFFNSPIANWDVSTITNMSNMFGGAKAFNQPLDPWIVSNVTDMSNMFFDADAFNQPLNSWNVSNVANMSEMFANSDAFNQPLNNWNVSNVTRINNMFKDAKVFNQPLDNWTVTNVTHSAGMLQMFFNAEAFNQSLASWDVSNIKDMTQMLTGTALSTENYDATLTAWDALASVQNNVTLGASATYCNSETARTSLQTKGWTINDNGFLCANVVESFNTTWQTTTANESITIPTTGGGYNYDVDWGDGIIETGFTGDASHTYAAVGTYTVKISGAFPRIYFNDTGDKDKIVSIEQWGVIAWINMSDAFEGCANLQVNATDAPDLSGVVNLSRMFRYCTTLNANFNNWDVSAIKFMPAMFEGATSFNGQISGWITTSLELTGNMFKGATVFNQDISGWDMTKVAALNGMFFNAEVFNQPIGSWVFTRAQNMRDVFNNAKQFNQPLANWNVSKVTSMFGMFHNADSFNQPIGGWNVEKVTNMINMFNSADVFNQPLDSWDVGEVNNMLNMFSDADAFNQPLDSWNVSNVLNMNNMFLNADVFNQALGSWDISSVTTMNNMFNNAIAFSTANYDTTLIGWNALSTLQSSSIVLTTSATYCASATARQNLMDTYGWNITDGGLDTNCGISFSPIVILQGAAINPNVGEEILMRDDLRVAGILPTTSPYVDAATCDATVFNQTGVDAVVDWVWVELRDATDNTIIVGGKSGLLTRGGFVFDTDGFSNLTFQQLPDNYHVVVKHRNHLGVMTNSSLPLSNISISVNFTDANNPITFGINAQTDFGIQPDKVAMWAGDVNGDGKIIFSNAGAESIVVKNTVLNDAGNTFNSVFYKPEGYYNADVNMNGEVVFLNSGNELLYVKDNILEHPGNIFGQIFYTITTQLP